MLRILLSCIRSGAHYSNLIVRFLPSSPRSLTISRNCELRTGFNLCDKGVIERGSRVGAVWWKICGSQRPQETGSHGRKKFAECWRAWRTDALPRRNQTVSDAGAAAGVHARQELA